MRSSRTTVGLRRPSMSGRATPRAPASRGAASTTRAAGVRTGTSTISGRRPRSARDPLDHLAVGQDVGAADVEALADRLRVAARRRRGSGRRPRARSAGSGVETHRGAIIAGSRSTSATIVSNAALPRPTTTAARSVVTGTAPGRERLGGLDPAAQVRREVGAVVAEAAEVDDLRDAGALGLARDGLRAPGGRPRRSRASRASGRGSRRPRRRRARGARPPRR